MDAEIEARLARIERKLNWIADVAWLAGTAAMILVMRSILVGMGQRPFPALIAAVFCMGFGGGFSLYMYRRRNS